MKKILLVTLIAGSFVSAAHAATVEGGKVTFNGLITSGACSVDADDTKKIVTLDTVPVSRFKTAAGGEYGNAKKAFTITLKDCDTKTLKTVSIAFTGQSVSGAADLLENTAGAGSATNVGLQLFGPDGAKLAVGSSSSVVNLVDAGETTIPLSVDYKSVGALPTAGKVQSVASFTLTYQ